LNQHQKDKRDYVYSRILLENAQTQGEYWNAAMREMKTNGFMHNFMRMYWGKKTLEWSRTPQGAFQTTLAVNNKYFLDGRDPNSYAGVAWVFGIHDRVWFERPIFGKIRYLAASATALWHVPECHDVEKKSPPRMAYRTWDRLDSTKKKEILKQAAVYRYDLNRL
jgi:deoxyribodipyrimidine photo-lyase